tara:strand:- start:66 stop:497 length:432 start_codon:yes stop_codon:yes gene_type:complete
MKTKKVNSDYKEAYKEYKQRLKNRPHKWGKTKCLVCVSEFNKTTGKHLYCSIECRRINEIKKELDLKEKQKLEKERIKEKHVKNIISKSNLGHHKLSSFASNYFVIWGLIIYYKQTNNISTESAIQILIDKHGDTLRELISKV